MYLKSQNITMESFFCMTGAYLLYKGSNEGIAMEEEKATIKFVKKNAMLSVDDVYTNKSNMTSNRVLLNGYLGNDNYTNKKNVYTSRNYKSVGSTPASGNFVMDTFNMNYSMNNSKINELNAPQALTDALSINVKEEWSGNPQRISPVCLWNTNQDAWGTKSLKLDLTNALELKDKDNVKSFLQKNHFLRPTFGMLYGLS